MACASPVTCPHNPRTTLTYGHKAPLKDRPQCPGCLRQHSQRTQYSSSYFMTRGRWRRRGALTSARYPACCHAERSPMYQGRQSGQISPDKNVNCRYTTAAFTISPESMGLRHVVLTCPDDGLVCCFCTSAHSFALGLPPDPSSRRRPCRRLVLLPRLTTVMDSNTGDLHPISSRP